MAVTVSVTVAVRVEGDVDVERDVLLVLGDVVDGRDCDCHCLAEGGDDGGRLLFRCGVRLLFGLCWMLLRPLLAEWCVFQILSRNGLYRLCRLKELDSVLIVLEVDFNLYLTVT